ncbi:HNH endonuclease [Nannocystis sp. ILAH1]|uniref:HNH endonuclease n=1 Tax=Nannocystis sp. ILAH1 TaxID=2996789 RepID=UPI00226D4F16|nr:HNH endonuclease [Nannocystis sp. ILAH1]MCY0989449.1 HNH endonuclease [Nannocystis sp. ILAH1]
MRRLERSKEPDILTKSKPKWTTTFLDKRKKNEKIRPSSTQYGHEQITDALAAMSFHKCFYCEQYVKDRAEVDHYIEVEERPDLAFEWSNLYLSCFDCNRRKENNIRRPTTQCIDPCDPSTSPTDHLTFDDEFIRGSSSLGSATIQKYLLSRDDLDHKRLKTLKCFYQAVIAIEQSMNVAHRSSMNSAELEFLRSFAAPERPFSLMFHVLLKRTGYMRAEERSDPGHLSALTVDA